jgi:hypothetical protein
VKPGEITEVTLNFDRPGKYTFYCTRWCSINHWRMRGVIEVTGPAKDIINEEPPLYVTLGLDIDAEHRAVVPLPAARPSAAQGEKLGQSLPADLLSREYYLAHSPAEAFKTLKATPDLGELPDKDLWNSGRDGMERNHVTGPGKREAVIRRELPPAMASKAAGRGFAERTGRACFRT